MVSMGASMPASPIFQARGRTTPPKPAGFDASTKGRTIYRGVDAKSQGVELDFGGRSGPACRRQAAIR
jgi:outer membrane receptor for ferric coprogen and ferric-rhodotorulic acid